MNNRKVAAALREVSPARIFARPTAEDLWLGPTRLSVLSQLSVDAATRGLVGPRSCGRSTLLRHLAQRNARLGPTLRLVGPKVTADEVLGALLRSAGLGIRGPGVDGMRRLLDVYLEGQRGLGSRVHLEIDDADRLGTEAWSEIERIAATGRDQSPPVLLLGLTAIETSRAPAAAYLRAAGAPAIGRLAWLDADEVASYLEWRFSRFGLTGINTPTATRLLARCSQGCFAALDHLSQIALLLLRQRDGHQLNVTVVREAMDRVKLLKAKRQTERDAVRAHGQPDPAAGTDGLRKNAVL